MGINVRPHVKVHKSVEIAKRQIAHGAIGLTCATVAEAELMSSAGIKNVMWTKQPASANNIARAVARAETRSVIHVRGGRPACRRLGRGGCFSRHQPSQDRCLGIRRDEPSGHRERPAGGGPGAARSLGRSAWTFEGFMAYSGGAAHTKDLAGSPQEVRRGPGGRS